jgi:hypothetical protein
MAHLSHFSEKMLAPNYSVIGNRVSVPMARPRRRDFRESEALKVINLSVNVSIKRAVVIGLEIESRTIVDQVRELIADDKNSLLNLDRRIGAATRGR